MCGFGVNVCAFKLLPSLLILNELFVNISMGNTDITIVSLSNAISRMYGLARY